MKKNTGIKSLKVISLKYKNSLIPYFLIYGAEGYYSVVLIYQCGLMPGANGNLSDW